MGRRETDQVFDLPLYENMLPEYIDMAKLKALENKLPYIRTVDEVWLISRSLCYRVASDAAVGL